MHRIKLGMVTCGEGRGFNAPHFLGTNTYADVQIRTATQLGNTMFYGRNWTDRKPSPSPIFWSATYQCFIARQNAL